MFLFKKYFLKYSEQKQDSEMRSVEVPIYIITIFGRITGKKFKNVNLKTSILTV